MVAGYYVSSDVTQLDIDVIHGFLSQSYWAKDIPLATMQRALDNSLCFGVYADSGVQVGFARMITDRATFAYLSDVFIVPEHRGQGLSKLLMSEIVAHADLQGLRRMALATSDAHGLYQQFGFTPLNHPSSFMELWQPNVYQAG